jgi:hypothetical protein
LREAAHELGSEGLGFTEIGRASVSRRASFVPSDETSALTLVHEQGTLQRENFAAADVHVAVHQ